MLKTSIAFLCLILSLLAFAPANAQSTSFTLQGKLNDGGIAANGTYDMQFKLYRSAAVIQVGPTITIAAVQVTNGIFTVRLDFGAVFDGTDRAVEVGIRPAGSNAAYTLLSPKTPITTAPYSIQANAALTADSAVTASTATDAARLGGVPAGEFVQIVDPRLADARNPLPGSADYIQNGTTPQPNSAFNVSGDGKVGGTLTANAVNSATEYRIGGLRVLNIDGQLNVFVGQEAGKVNTLGSQNTFVGSQAGFLNTQGTSNTFVGEGSGAANLIGSGNSFFGTGAGRNSTSNLNSFFGEQAGLDTTSGNENSFFGSGAGFLNVTGSRNAAFGRTAGRNNQAGNDNVFIGFNAGRTNTNESGNIYIGSGTTGAVGITNSAAIGTGATVTQSDTIVLGTNAVTVVTPGNLTVNGTLNANLPSGSTNYIQNTLAPQANASFNVAGSGRVGGTFSAGSIALNDALLKIRGDVDNSQGVRYDAVVDGPEFRGFGGFRWTYGFEGSTEAMRIGSNGFLGIGTANPTERLSVDGNGKVTGKVSANSFSATTDYQISNQRILSTDAVNGTLLVGPNTGDSLNGGSGNTFLGSRAGQETTTGFSNIFVGLSAGRNNLIGSRNTFVGTGAGLFFNEGDWNTLIGTEAGGNLRNESLNTLIGGRADIVAGVSHSTALGANAVATGSNQIVLGSSQDQVVMPGLIAGGQTNLCTNGSKFVLMCSSSLRFKTNIRPYSRSLEVISKLRPIAFDWKDGGMKDVGFGAEDVAKIDPLLVTYDDKGAVVGVKYDRLSTVFVNAFREQQDQIKRQQDEISSQKKLVARQQDDIAKQKELIDAQRRKLAAQDDAIASLGRRFEQLAQQVARNNSLRQSQASTRRRAHTKSRR